MALFHRRTLINRRAFASLLAMSISAAALGGFSVTASAGDAGKPIELKAVLELFTSQGCSSCPPADALLKDYVERDDVIALSFPVDYWDYLGWKDTFGSPAHSARQRAYAAERGDGLVYTPQIVVNGRQHAVGSRRNEIERAIAATQRTFESNRIPVSLSQSGAGLTVEFGNAPAGAAISEATIWLAVVTKAGKVNVRRGENGGRELVYYSVVRDLKPLGKWAGGPLQLAIPGTEMAADGVDGCVVLLQKGTSGPIIGGARLWNRSRPAVVSGNQG